MKEIHHDTSKNKLIEGVKLIKLDEIKDERGSLTELHNLLWSVTEIKHMYVTKAIDYAKAWHLHCLQEDHFNVIEGIGHICLYDARIGSETKDQINEFILEPLQYLLIIPKLVFHGFEPYNQDKGNLVKIINTPNRAYNPTIPDEYKIHYNDHRLPLAFNCKHGDHKVGFLNKEAEKAYSEILRNSIEF